MAQENETPFETILCQRADCRHPINDHWMYPGGFSQCDGEGKTCQCPHTPNTIAARHALPVLGYLSRDPGQRPKLDPDWG